MDNQLTYVDQTVNVALHKRVLCIYDRYLFQLQGFQDAFVG